MANNQEDSSDKDDASFVSASSENGHAESGSEALSGEYSTVGWSSSEQEGDGDEESLAIGDGEEPWWTSTDHQEEEYTHRLRAKYLAPIDSEEEANGADEFEGFVHPKNTVGRVPLEWYEDYPHIGYDLDGKRILKPATKDELDTFLAKMDDPEAARTFRDHEWNEDAVLTAQEVDIIKKLQAGAYPDADYDPYPDAVDFFTQDVMTVPLSAAPEPKRRFVPSKWEHQRVMKIVRAIRRGLIVPGSEAAKEKRKLATAKKSYAIWDDADAPESKESSMTGRITTAHIPAPKMKLPEHAESYNPPEEYLPTADEEKEYADLDPEDRPRNYLPRKFPNLRSVPGYSRFINERFGRCLDLYLCPRAFKKRILNPESLLPDLPDPKDLEPFPKHVAITYRGHQGRIRTISADPTGQWLISGSDDQSVRLWEISSGRCMQTWSFHEPVVYVAWNPNKNVCLFAVAVGTQLVLVHPRIAAKHTEEATVTLLQRPASSADNQDSPAKRISVQWEKPSGKEKANGVELILQHKFDVSFVAWHKKGDYFATLCPDAGNQSVLIHQLVKKQTQNPFTKSKGAVQRVLFHPSKPFLMVATQRYVRVYNLIRQELHKCLESGAKWISSMDVHPLGDNVIIGTYDKKVCWFDMDLSAKPYKILRYHDYAVRNVTFHKRYPLFASCSDDGSVHVFHGMVYNDFLQNPTIVPVKILKGHERVGSLGSLCCEFHPHQPWVFSSGADHLIQLYC